MSAPVAVAETPLDALIMARAYIEDPERWTQGTYRSSSGQCCAVGALRLACDAAADPVARSYSRAVELLYDAAQEAGWGGPVGLNDCGAHGDALDMFDRAIAVELGA